MFYQPTKVQVEQYQRDGFLLLENFLTADELAHWRSVTDEAVEQRLEASKSAAGWGKDSNSLTNQNTSDNYYSQVFTQCVRLADTHAGMRELMLDPRLGELVGTLAGVDSIRIWHDQALIKPPYGNPTAWHLDNPYWSFSSQDALSIWVALDDATLANGCMWYLPGSHKLATYENAGIGKNQRDLFKIYPDWLDIASVSAPAKAGSAVIHNGLTAHGAGANMTNGQRRAMTCAYMPAGSTFNGKQNILPDELFQSYQIGDVLDSDFNPLIWSKTKIEL